MNTDSLVFLLNIGLISNVAILAWTRRGGDLPTSVYFPEEAVALATVIVTRKAPEILR